MCEENTSQKERFLQEVEQKLLHRELDARLLEDGLIHVTVGIRQALGVRAEKGYACHTVGPRDGGNNITEFFNAVWRHKTTPLLT